jgi:hypothetical protein
MFQQTCHTRPIAQATLARVLRPSLVDRLETEDLSLQQVQLARAHIKYILLDGRLPWMADDGVKADYATAYRVVFRSPDLVILRVY